MNQILTEKMKRYISYFEEWADAIFENADEAFIQDNYAENKLYKVISNMVQDTNTVDLEKLRTSQIYDEFQKNIGEWGALYQNRFMQSRRGVEILNSITVESSEILDLLANDEETAKFYGKTIDELVSLRNEANRQDRKWSTEELQTLLQRTFNLIEKAYVELAYSIIDDQIAKNHIDETNFWEEPIMEYIMETWWPKRRVYRNRILLIDINNFPKDMKFEYKNFMSDKFYKSGIFGFLKQLRNQLTHVKTSGYHEELTKELYTEEFMSYWCRMNAAIAIYIISYLSSN